ITTQPTITFSQPAATAITDIDEVQPTITINDQPITPSSLQFSISDNAEEAIEEIDITLPEENDPSIIETTAEEEIVQSSAAQAVMNESHNNISPEPQKPEFIGHEIDPRSGMPIPVKAPKEYPMAGRLPGLDLLGNPPPVTESYDALELQEFASLIEEQFKNFNIEVKVVKIEPSPVIPR